MHGVMISKIGMKHMTTGKIIDAFILKTEFMEREENDMGFGIEK